MAYTTIDKPTDYFNTVLWTGTSDATTSVTGVNFQPDFVWIKNRNVADDHTLHDVVRGSTKTLFSNATNSEGTNTESIKSFDTDGFTTGNHRGTGGDSGNGMVAWNWLADNTSGSSNTDGSITSTVSANTTAGFSIVSYTGTGSNATVGHGLGVAPNMIINKCRSAAQNWATFHSSLGGTKALFLDGTDAATSSVSYFNNTNPTSSVFSVGNSGDTNKSSQTHISYCFAEKKGFSKFGSYTGNGNSDGTFIYTGFKPAFVITKRADTGGDNWHMLDNKRDIDNPAEQVLQPNGSDTEATTSTSKIDFLSNGFKCRGTGASINTSGLTYVYIAFAESPFVTSTGIPTTAR